MLDILERFEGYDQTHCWQYQIRVDNKKQDLIDSGLTEEEASNLRVSDFVMEFVPKTDKQSVKEIKEFIERHEWLGKISIYPTHFFTARYKGILAGVIIMDMPNAFSKILGEKTKKLERLISRGACISWSPKNLASSLIMFSIKWMVKNSNYRVFTAYSDPEAKELGTIYQACNFYYMGQNSGAGKQYKIDSGKWVSDRYFRSRSVYKKLAVNSGIEWDATWVEKEKLHWNLMPPEIVAQIRQLSKDYQKRCVSREIPKKHKYVYILGIDKIETRRLRKEFEDNFGILPYPKERRAY